ALKGLVHRRRLMDAPDNRLEVVDVERPRVVVTVPADDIEGMMIEYEFVDRVVLFDENREVTPFLVRLELGRPANVPFAIRRAFEELAELVPVALGRTHVPATLEHEELGGPPGVVDPPAMGDVAMDHHVVARADRQGGAPPPRKTP